MIILDKPYVSEALKASIRTNATPVLENEASRAAFPDGDVALTPSDEFARMACHGTRPRIYSNSENAIDWMARNLDATGLPARIDLFKDKVAFRELVRPLYPDYFFQGVLLKDLASVDPSTLPKPCIVKPAVGFFSLGVHTVDTDADWPVAVAAIHAEVDAIRKLYPAQVLDTGRFIIEESIDGDEFAVDVYYDSEGKPVVVNVLRHIFASAHDVSDRLYITSTDIVSEYGERFMPFFAEIGRLGDLKDFPAHIELRVADDGSFAPIEVNPMRFAGWCVADMTSFSYGVDPYQCFLKGHVPDWAAIAKGRENTVYGMIIGDIPADISAKDVAGIDYDAFAARFEKPLELRRMDYQRYGVFAFIFTQTRADNMAELTDMLDNDMREFLRLR